MYQAATGKRFQREVGLAKLIFAEGASTSLPAGHSGPDFPMAPPLGHTNTWVQLNIGFGFGFPLNSGKMSETPNTRLSAGRPAGPLPL